MPNPKLKNCPFCSGPALLYEWKPDPETCTGFTVFARFGVKCSRCDATGPFTDNILDKGAEASTLWNRRKRSSKTSPSI